MSLSLGAVWNMADRRFLRCVPTFFISWFKWLLRVFLHDSVSMFVKTFQCPETNESAPLPSRSNHLKRRPCISLVGLRKTQRLQKRSFILIKYTLAAGQGCRRDSDLNCTASEINLIASGVYVSFCVGCVHVCGCCVCVYVFHWRIVMTSFISEVDLTAFICVRPTTFSVWLWRHYRTINLTSLIASHSFHSVCFKNLCSFSALKTLVHFSRHLVCCFEN